MSDATGNKISFDQTDILRATAIKRHKEGFYRLRVPEKPTGHVNDKGNRVLTLPFVAVDENGQARGPNNLKNWLALPLRTSKQELEDAGLGSDFKQEIPDTVGQAQQVLRALYGPEEFPRFPKFDEENSTQDTPMYRTEDGELVTADEKREMVETQLIPNIFQKLCDLWEDPADLQGRECFAKLYYRTSKKNGKTYLNITKLSYEEPEDGVVDLDEAYEYVTRDGSVVGADGGEAAAPAL